PDITLTHQVVTADQLTQQQLALARGDSPIDLAYTDVGYELGQAGAVDPIDLGPLSRQIVPVALDAQSSGVQVYAFPVFLSVLGLYVNKARLTAAQIDPAQALRDWASFETAARKLTDRSGKKYGFDVFGSGSPLSGERRYGPFLWTAGGGFFDDTGAQATWDQRPGLEALIFLARLSQNYASPDSAVADDKTLQGNWLAGQTATILAGPELTIDADRHGLGYAAQSVPAYIQGQASSLASSQGAIAVFARSRHKDWGLDLARYLAGKDAQVTGLATIPLLPANGDAGDAAPAFSRNPVLAEFLRILREDDVHAFPRPRTHPDEVAEIFRVYLGIALQGKATPELAWKTSASQATALIRSALTPTPARS
ncbi:MAG TPA: extracellular solute-binding protein, partial [Chloroflexota bacterium]|nr:extracellular solute-binding protein [Chloroflexota bacterium]